MRLCARHYATGELVTVVCADGRVQAIDAGASGAAERSAGWIAPVSFDLQINGCDGKSFTSPTLTIDDVRHVVSVCRRHGVGALCPTLVTNSFAALAHGFATLRRACEEDAALAR